MPPASSKREPWHGHTKFCCSVSQRTVQPRCGPFSDMTRKWSFSTRITSSGFDLDPELSNEEAFDIF